MCSLGYDPEVSVMRIFLSAHFAAAMQASPDTQTDSTKSGHTGFQPKEVKLHEEKNKTYPAVRSSCPKEGWEVTGPRGKAFREQKEREIHQVEEELHFFDPCPRISAPGSLVPDFPEEVTSIGVEVGIPVMAKVRLCRCPAGVHET